MLFGCLLPSLIAAYTDARNYIVPDLVTLPILLAGLIEAMHGNLANALFGVGFAFGVTLVCALMGGMGGGDVKLAAGLGIWFGFHAVQAVLVGAALLGVAWGLFRLARRGRLRGWVRTFFVGLYLRLGGVKGAIPMGQLPEDGSVPQEAVPFGTCLALAAWGYAVWLLLGGRGLNP